MGALILPRKVVTQGLDEGAKRLKNNAALQIPWGTDEKHYRNRFQLLLDECVSFDDTAAAAPSGGEIFGEYENARTNI